jgi:SNF2 family DNA or RNA helicase
MKERSVISKSAVDLFLQSERDDNSWMKWITKKQATNELRSYGFSSKTTPFLHQQTSALLGIAYNNFTFHLDMGLGKTWIILNILAHRKQLEPPYRLTKTLVLVPNILNVLTWQDEVVKHSDLSILGVTGTSADDKWNELMEGGKSSTYDLVVMDYFAAQSLFSDKRKKSKGKGFELIPNVKTLSMASKLFPGIVCDEIHKAKNPESLRHRIVHQLTNKATHRYGLTGTPFGRNPEDLWAEFHLIDRGETLGPSLTMFRQAFFKQKYNHFSYGNVEWVFDDKKRELLNHFLQHRSIAYTKEECVSDIPTKSHIRVRVPLTAEQKKLLQALRNRIIAASTPAEKENAFVQARQITAGVVYQKDDSDRRFAIRLSESPKLQEMLDRLQNLSPTEKVIIFYEFTASGDLISDALTAEKVNFVRIWSGEKDKLGKYQSFLQVGPKTPQVMVAQWQMAESGINPQGVCRYIFYFESPVSPIPRAQTEARVYRMGQTRPVVLYDFCAANSIDEKVLDYLQEGKSLFDSIIRGTEAI